MQYRLGIDHPHALGEHASKCVTDSLHVADDFPVSIGYDGTVLSRFGDDVWDLTPYSFRVVRISFVFKVGYLHSESYQKNVLLFKRAMFWLLYGTRILLSIKTIQNLHSAYRSIFKFSLENGVLASELRMNALIQEKLILFIGAYQRRSVANPARKMYLDRDSLGFYTLSPLYIDKLLGLSHHHKYGQTPCIPERIFFYIVERCTKVIDQYLQHEAAIRCLYEQCASTSLRMRQELGQNAKYARVRSQQVEERRRSIGALEHYSGKAFDKWLDELGLRGEITGLIQSTFAPGPKTLGTYLTFVSLASRILLCALSGMREQEHRMLRQDCHETREDPLLGTIHFLRGESSKTVKQRQAYWVTSELAGKAFAVARSISFLRAEYAEKFRDLFGRGGTLKTNMLFARNCDPWFGVRKQVDAYSVNPQATTAGALLSFLASAENRLFDQQKLTVTEEDLQQALRLSPELDKNKFSVGKPWPLAWHQFRRTLVCLALGSGVSLPAMAWQLKHAGPAMTMYYGNNYFQLSKDDGLRTEFTQAQIEMLLIKADDLQSGDYLPTCKEGKSPLLRLLSENDGQSLRRLARLGKFSIRDTAIGVCTNPSPCTFGGWEHLTECLSCVHALASIRNKDRMLRMLQIIEADISECSDTETLLRSSLEAQQHAVKAALKIISHGE